MKQNALRLLTVLLLVTCLTSCGTEQRKKNDPSEEALSIDLFMNETDPELRRSHRRSRRRFRIVTEVTETASPIAPGIPVEPDPVQ